MNPKAQSLTLFPASFSGFFFIRLVVGVVVVFAIGLGVILFPPAEYRRGGLANSVTAQKLRSVELGFSAAQVAAILGPPIEVNPNAGDGLSYLHYSKKLKWPFFQPKIWIVCRNGKVIEVRVERMAYWGDDFDSEYYNKSQYGIREAEEFRKVFAVDEP